MSQQPLKWIDILTIKSDLLKKSIKIAKNNCSLPAQKSRGAVLLVRDASGKALLGATEYGFPASATCWKGMIAKVKAIHPTAHTLHMQVAVNSSKGNRDFRVGTFKEWTGSAEALVYTYPEGAVIVGEFRKAA